MLCPDRKISTLIKTDTNQFVHKECAQGIPECTIKDSICVNFKKFQKSRFDLKCTFCKVKQGACIQCSKTNCWVSFHVTCANKYSNYKYNSDLDYGECFCKWHDEYLRELFRIDRKRKIEMEELSRIENAVLDFQVGNLVIVKVKNCSYQGIVEELNEELQNCVVGFYGSSYTIEWKNLSKFSTCGKVEELIKRVKEERGLD